MIFRNLIFQAEVIEQRFGAGLVSHHEQQASKCNGEQQHRVLWPAYNLNIAPPQASTEGLFQQTRLFSTTIHLALPASFPTRFKHRLDTRLRQAQTVCVRPLPRLAAHACFLGGETQCREPDFSPCSHSICSPERSFRLPAYLWKPRNIPPV